jgi:DNA-binding ferritin-like protein (Dps family)
MANNPPIPTFADLTDFLRRIGADQTAPVDDIPKSMLALPSDWTQRYNDVVKKLQDYAKQAQEMAEEWRSTAGEVATYLWDLAAHLWDAVYQTVMGLIDAVHAAFASFWEKIKDVVGSPEVGLKAYELSKAWRHVSADTSSAASSLDPQQLEVYADFPAGDPRLSYLGTIAIDIKALTHLYNTGKTVVNMLEAVAGFALFFYAAIAAVLANLVMKLAAGVAAARNARATATPQSAQTGGSFMTGLAGQAQTVIEEALAAYLATKWQLDSWVTPLLRAEDYDNTGLPDGKWPDPKVKNFTGANLATP